MVERGTLMVADTSGEGNCNGSKKRGVGQCRQEAGEERSAGRQRQEE